MYEHHELPDRIEIEAERARRSLRLFVELAWPQIEPGVWFVPGYHIDAICELLEAFTAGEISRLAINIPPRHGKSTLVSVAWIAWAWAVDPTIRWLTAAYGEALAVRDSARCRRLLESFWFRQRWGDRVRLRDDQNAKHRFENDRGGVRLATSVGAGATGEGGDILVVDDLHKLEDAYSAAARRNAIDWYSGTLSTRLNDPRKGGIVAIGQRIHWDDVFANMLSEGDWTHLCLPAEYDPTHPFLWPDDPRTKPGEPLWPGHFGTEELERLKRQLGSHGAASQLQQLPAPTDGAIFLRKDWRFYQPAELPGRFDQVVQSWDCTFGDSKSSDYVVGQVWAALGPDRYLLRQVRGRLSFLKTLDKIRETTEWVNTHHPGQAGHPILIEKSANGPAIINVLKHELPGLIAIVVEEGKASRAHAVSPQVEAGNVWLPGVVAAEGNGFDPAHTEQWVHEFVFECEAFPFGANDDQVDAMSQALLRLNRRPPRVRALIGR